MHIAEFPAYAELPADERNVGQLLDVEVNLEKRMFGDEMAKLRA